MEVAVLSKKNVFGWLTLFNRESNYAHEDIIRYHENVIVKIQTKNGHARLIRSSQLSKESTA